MSSSDEGMARPAAHGANREIGGSAERRFYGILEIADDAIVSLDATQHITLFNQGAERIFGYSEAEVLGQPLDILLPARLVAVHRLNIARFASSPIVARRMGERSEIVARRKDGAEFPAEASISKLDLDGEWVFTAILRDITSRKLADQERLARQAAEQANNAKSAFLSRMSHELRTPLNAILGFAQLLEMDDLNDAQRESVEHILIGGRHLLGLVNEVLDIARIEQGFQELTLEPVRLAGALDEALDLLAPLAAQRGISIAIARAATADPDWLVLADRRHIMAIMLNLVSNAIKYNRLNGWVLVRYARLEEDPARIRVEVSDSGPGIAPDKLPRLFMPFERLDATLSDIPGTGLGLTLVKLLAEAMSCRVGVSSVPGQGSTFWLDLPLAIPGAAPA